MPRGDGTGPWGQGPRTGRGLGYCSGYDRPGFTQPGFGPGMGRGRFFSPGMGFGRGRGRGRGFRWFAPYYYNPYAGPYYPGNYNPGYSEQGPEQQENRSGKKNT